MIIGAGVGVVDFAQEKEVGLADLGGEGKREIGGGEMCFREKMKAVLNANMVRILLASAMSRCSASNPARISIPLALIEVG